MTFLDNIRRFGRVAVAPDDVGDVIKFKKNDKWIGHGFVTSTQPFYFAEYNEDKCRNYCVAPVGAGLNSGDRNI